jgi:nucleoside-diphosphate-sugar epimerase
LRLGFPDPNTMRVFVTGGSGFVGRKLIEVLRERGDTVRALARSDAAARTVEGLGAIAVRGDLDDSAALQNGMSGCELVFHCAAKVDQWGDPQAFQRVNVAGTANVAEAACAASVRRMVHVSTEAVLAGGGPIRRADETRPRAARPVGLYPRTKAQAEAVALDANGERLEVVVCRPRMIWGQGDSTVLPQIIDVMRKKQWAWISGGRYPTSTCHVRNVVEGLLLAAERGRPGEIYFLSDGEPIEFRAFWTRIARTQGVDPGTRSVPRALLYPVAVTLESAWRLLRLRGAPPVTRMAILLAGEEVTVSDAKARRELGYLGRVTREQGLAEMENTGPR